MNNHDMQKDWIIYNTQLNKIFCIAIYSKDGGKTWKLIEFVNMFDISPQEFIKTITMGYKTMIDAAQELGKNYQYVIAEHTFDKKEVDTPYWHNLVPADKFWSMATIENDINKQEFEDQMNKLLKTVYFKNF